MKFEVTLKQLRKYRASKDCYNKVVSHLKGIESDGGRETYTRFIHAEPISLVSILESNGLDDALWCLRCNSDWDRDSRLFAVWCARQVQYLMTDERSINALDVAENFANGLATLAELNAARDAANATSDTTWAVVSAVTWAAARTAAWAVAKAAVSDAASDAQKEMFIKMCNGKADWQIEVTE